MKTVSQLISAAVNAAITVGLYFFATRLPKIFSLWYPRFSAWILGVVADVTDKVPFPIWEILTVLLALWGVYTLIRSILKLKFIRWLSGFLWAVTFGVLLFTLFWGAGHFVPTKTEQIVTTREYSVEELLAATDYYGEMAGNYVGGDFSDTDAMLETANEGFHVLRQNYDCFPEAEVTVKKLLAGKAFSYMGTTGIFVPMTAETCLNPDTYPVSQPFTACHEIAHRLGAAGEADANFCAFLATTAHPSEIYRYSGYYSAFIYCYNALSAANPTLAKGVWDRLDPQVQADIRGATEHYAPYKGKVQDAAQSVNDTYLKAVGQEGVRSYGLVSDALIAWYQENKN